MRKREEAGKLYYSNPDKVRGARVSRDMMMLLCNSLGEVFDANDTRHFISKTRIPNERELYGTFIKALLSNRFESQIGHIATEVQVSRQNDDASGKGRVDIIFDYRRTSFLVELKVIRASVNGRLPGEENSTPTQRLVKPWQQAVRQLDQLDETSLGEALNTKIVKLPIALYLHVDNRQKENSEEWKELSASTHERIVSQLDDDIDDSAPSNHHFSYFQPLQEPIKTSRRRGCLVEGTPDVRLYGFTLIAACQ